MTTWTDIYEELRTIWEESPGRGKRAALEQPHKITAKDLIAELNRLARDTYDFRFDWAIEALEENELIDENSDWRRGLVSRAQSEIDSDLMAAMAEAVQKGLSIRIAAAGVAARNAVPAASFDAAVKRLQRLWHEHGDEALWLNSLEPCLPGLEATDDCNVNTKEGNSRQAEDVDRRPIDDIDAGARALDNLIWTARHRPCEQERMQQIQTKVSSCNAILGSVWGIVSMPDPALDISLRAGVNSRFEFGPQHVQATVRFRIEPVLGSGVFNRIELGEHRGR
jgi:hypothetical protein